VKPETLDHDQLYHLVTPGEWDVYGRRGQIVPESLATEGFVHCSWGRQVAATVARHFPGVEELLALRIDETALDGVPMVEEDSYGSGQTFPHLYGPVPVGAVVGVVRLAG